MSEKPKINVKKRNWAIISVILLGGGFSMYEYFDNYTGLPGWGWLSGAFGIFFWSYILSSIVWAIFFQRKEFTQVMIYITVVLTILSYIGSQMLLNS